MVLKYEFFGLVGFEFILLGILILFVDNIGCLEVFKKNFGYIFFRNNIEILE